MRFSLLFLVFLVFEVFGDDDYSSIANDSEFKTESVDKSCRKGLARCVPATLCSNHTEGSNQFGTVDVSFDDERKPHECHYLEKCCEIKSVITKREGQSFIAKTSNVNLLDACVKKCHAGSSSSKAALTEGAEILLPISQFCGLRNIRGIGMELKNGLDAAQFGEFPWMMALMSNGKYACGGSLIHPSVVLTAAHCVADKDISTILLRAGEWDTQTTNEPFHHSDHKVKKTIVHPNFGNRNMFNDIALLILDTPVELSIHINTICLPPQNFKFNEMSCYATGWGVDQFGQEGSKRANLKIVKLPTVSLNDCQSRLRSTRLGEFFKIDMSFMCAGGEMNVDTCTGDGGSPLVCPVPGEESYYYQAGIVSWGIDCGINGIPGVYTNVAKFREWIDNEMIGLGFRTRSYSY